MTPTGSKHLHQPSPLIPKEPLYQAPKAPVIIPSLVPRLTEDVERAHGEAWVLPRALAPKPKRAQFQRLVCFYTLGV